MSPRNYYKSIIKRIIKKVTANQKFIVLENTVTNSNDIQKELTSIKKKIDVDTKIILIYYNHLWEPILKFATFLGFREDSGDQNWLDEKDVNNILFLSDFEVITTQKRILLPIDIPFISTFINRYIASLPILNSLCLLIYTVARPIVKYSKEFSVSIIIPARNEEGNIRKILPSIPKFGTSQEFIFVEGNSSDHTWEEINKLKDVIVLKQKGKGKRDAVKVGFSKAKGEILMIYDADRTVAAADLEKFYDALQQGKAQFANGSRLIYPMEKDAMRTFNKVGNKVFSLLFTWILGQRFKDTLCGTKAFFRKDYLKFTKLRQDPFGDFELIFGAIDRNLKVVEIPVVYKERVYGSTNISRFKNGLQLLQMVIQAFRRFRYY